MLFLIYKHNKCYSITLHLIFTVTNNLNVEKCYLKHFIDVKYLNNVVPFLNGAIMLPLFIAYQASTTNLLMYFTETF